MDVWRRAFALLSKTGDFTGPFYEAGYTDTVIEPTLTNDTNPDMITVNHDFHAVLEVTFSPNKEFRAAKTYAQGELTPLLRTRLGSQPRRSAGAPFLVTNQPTARDLPPDFNAVQVDFGYSVRLPHVEDALLKKHLEQWPGFTSPPPGFLLLAVPESEIAEVKVPLAGFLKSAAASGTPITANTLAEKLMGDLANCVSSKGKNALEGKVADLLEMAGAKLGSFVAWNSASRTLSFKKPISNPKSRKSFTKELGDWLGTATLDTFIPPGEDDEEEEDEEEETDEE